MLFETLMTGWILRRGINYLSQMIIIIICDVANSSKKCLIMPIRFLCDTHRKMLSEHPGKATNAWLDSFDRGASLYDTKRWRKSLSFFGTAYEIACIIMTSRAVEPNSAYELITTSAVSLANSFVMLGYEGESRKVYALAINHLEQEGQNSVAGRLSINHYLGHLYRNIRRLDCRAEKTGVIIRDTVHLMSEQTMH